MVWIGGGGPLALRWWQAAVAAVHCRLDDMALDDAREAFKSLTPVLNLSLFMPPPGKGEAVTWTAPFAGLLSASATAAPMIHQSSDGRL